MIFALALLACSTGTAPNTPIADAPHPSDPPADVPVEPAPEIPAILLADSDPSPMPVGSPTVRDCSKITTTTTRRTVTRPTPMPRPMMDKSAARPDPAPPGATGTGLGGVGTQGSNFASGSADFGGGAAPVDAAPSAEPSVASAPAPAAQAPAMPAPSAAHASAAETTSTPVSAAAPRALGPAGDAASDGFSKADAADRPPEPWTEAAKGEAKPKASDGAGRETAERASIVDKPVAKDVTTPYYDWGGVTWLSNDDSMSLASAQHVLHAVANGERLQSSEIRPHELLNYFSFDTAPVPENTLFSVLPSAEKTDPNTLTVAVAVKGAMPPRRPMDLTLIVDRSGSMVQEGRMEYVKRGLQLMTNQLVIGDRVDLVLFDNTVCTPVENYVVGRDDPAILTGAIAKMQPAGGTNIGIGLKAGYDLVSSADREAGIHRNRRVMLLTDAQVNQGAIDADALGLVAEGFEKHGVRLTGVGVGVGFNDHVLDTVTDRGHGAYVYLGSEAVVDRLFGVGFRSMVETIAHDVQFELDLPPSLAMAKFYGEESSTVQADIQPIDYYAGTTQLFLQDLRVDPAKLAPTDAIKMTVHYRDAFTDEPGTQTFAMNVGELLGSDRRDLDKGRALIAWTDLLQAKAMGGDACGAPLQTWTDRAGKVSNDAEIAYVHTLVGKTCPWATPLAAPDLTDAQSVAYKVRVDSDVPIAEVALACAGQSHTKTLTGADTIARFDARPGACTLTLQGNVPMVAQVDVPPAGGDVKCTIRGGRLSCG